MTQTYRAWRHDAWPDEPLDLASLFDGPDGLLITLKALHESTSTPVVQVHFARPFMYRSIDEGYRLKQQGAFECDRKSVVYTVADSPLVAELQQQSLGTLKNLNLVHYLVATTNDWIDVISEVEPRIRRGPKGAA